MADPVHSIDDFLAVVRKSGLVEGAKLEAACAEWPDRSQPLPDELVRKLVGEKLLTQWQTDQLRKGKHRGFVLGKYRLLSLLGAGGMSSVYLAEHTNLHGNVAIKVLPVKNVDKTSYLARFEREAREAFRLSHHNIVRAIDLDTSGSIHYLVMEYVEGTDLHAKVKQEGPLPIRDAVDYVRQAALGLQCAHEEGVVHRDIKPANLILDRRGTVKILDFGLALAGKGDEDGSLTQEFGEKVLGTADYLAPEQARDSHQADNRSDIYALGCTLYYLLAGKVPFPGGKLADRIRAHETAPPPNPLDVRPDVPPAIVDLYFRMMAKHPEGRPQTAREVADSLGSWLGAIHGPAAAGPAQLPRRLPPRQASPDRGGGPSSSGPGPIVLAPPASGAGRRPPGSGLGSGPLVFAPPSSGVGRGSRPTPPTRVPISRPGRSGADADELDDAVHPRGPWSFAGLPLGAWVAVGVGVALAIGLGVMVLLNRGGSRGSRPRVDTVEEGVEEPRQGRPRKPGGTSGSGRTRNTAKPADEDAEPSALDGLGAPN